MQIYWKILRYGTGFQKTLSIAILCLVGYNLFSVASLSMVIPFLEILFQQNNALPPPPTDLKSNVLYWLSKQIQLYGKPTVLLYFCLTVAISILIKNTFRYIGAYSLAPLEFGIIQQIRTALFGKLTVLSLAYYSRQRRGQILNLITTDLEIIQQAVVGTITPLLSDPLTMLFFLIMMTLLSWQLTLFTLLVLPLTGLVISRIARSLKRKAQKGQNRLDRLISVVDEFISGIRVIKAFTAESQQSQKFAYYNQEYTLAMTGFRRRTELASPLTEILTVAVVLVIMYYGASLIIAGESGLLPSEFIGFIILFSQFIAPIKTFSAAISRVQKAMVSYQRIENFLQEKTLATEQNIGKNIEKFEHSILIKDLTFGYDSELPVLRNINLEIRKGETVALVGPSGSGKSTLIDLICRFYDPQVGNILIDGQDVKELNPVSYRNLLGMVTQEPVLFHDSVEANITLGKHTGKADLIQAATVANAAGFIEALPYQYETLLGERGSRLSGGQRQRVAIARAVFHNPPILILDEATSALDSESEQLVQQAIDRLTADRTCIVIAHRLSTIVHADKIYVLNDGQIVETGNHQSLIQIPNGLYRRLYDIQFVENNSL